VNFSKIAKALPGFKPQWNVRQGVQELYGACREADLKLDDFDGPRFKRINHIRKLLAAGQLNSQLHWTHPVTAEAPAAG
jgi:hypothetical protein